MKYTIFAGQIPKIRKNSKKRGNFFGRHVDVHNGGQAHTWTHVDRGRVPKTRFSCGRHKWMAPYPFPHCVRNIGQWIGPLQKHLSISVAFYPPVYHLIIIIASIIVVENPEHTIIQAIYSLANQKVSLLADRAGTEPLNYHIIDQTYS